MGVSNGVVVTDIEGIWESWASFYQELFTACPVDLGSSQIFLTVSVYLFLLMMPLFVTVRSRLMRLMLLSLAWLRASLQALMVFQWNFMLLPGVCLVGDLVNVFNASLEAGLLPFSQREALIALIFKKGDRLVAYKLCARVLAGRLLKVIATVVATDQTCGVPGRYIGENVAFLRDVVELVNEYARVPSLILANVRVFGWVPGVNV